MFIIFTISFTTTYLGLVSDYWNLHSIAKNDKYFLIKPLKLWKSTEIYFISQLNYKFSVE